MSKIQVKVTGVKAFLRRIKDYGEDAPEIIDEELSAGALDMVKIAKRLAPVDEGFLRNEIGANVSKRYNKEFFSGVFYSAYIEFGTGSKTQIPANYEAFAAKYKGPAKRGNIKQFYQKLVKWVIRKGITATYSVKTQRRRKVGARETERAEQIAFAIMLSILKNGIQARPFFIPAYKKVEPVIAKTILKRIRKLK